MIRNPITSHRPETRQARFSGSSGSVLSPGEVFFTANSDEYLFVYGCDIYVNHPREVQVMTFDSILKRIFKMDRIKYARVFCRTSDINWQRYEVFVKEMVRIFFLHSTILHSH